jgi:hypothetical protein
MITAALRSGVPKKRANALETIEQGVGPPFFKELRPLLGGNTSTGNRSHDPRGFLLDETLRSAVRSPHSVECSAAALCFLNAGRPEDLALIRQQLSGGAHSLLHDTVLTHLDGRAQDGRVLAMDQLTGFDFFRSLSVWDLADVAAGSERIRFFPGEPMIRAGDPAVYCYLVLSGLLQDGPSLRGPGEVVGMECLASMIPCRYPVRCREAGEAYKVPASLLSDLGRRSPGAAEELLRFRHSSRERLKLA